MKKALGVLLVFVLVCGSVALAEPAINSPSAETVVQRASPFFDTYATYIVPGVGGKFTIEFYTEACGTVAVVGVTSFDIYAKAPGGSWSNCGTFTGYTNSNVASCSFSEGFQGTSGHQYYVVARHYCRKYDGTSATTTLTSSVVTVY